MSSRPKIREIVATPRPIAEIKIGDRHRKDMGDLSTLVDSIKLVGLLQPIGVTPGLELVFGERRLRACQELGWSRIPARTVRIESIVAGEFHENEIRKDFTPSERVAILKAIEAKIKAERKRGRQDKVAHGPPLKGKSRKIAAERSGFESEQTARRAAKVVNKGTPELVAAMDSDKLSIRAAAEIAELPREQQNAQIELPTTAEAKRIAKETGTVVMARNGRYYGSSEGNPERDALGFAIMKAVEAVNSLPPAAEIDMACIPDFEWDDFEQQVAKARDWLEAFAQCVRESRHGEKENADQADTERSDQTDRQGV